MSKAQALVRARALRDELVKRGVPTSIEIQQGRPGTPNGRWYDTRFIGSMGHHIVSRRSQGLTPGLALVKRGRPDVPGPLCNGYLGFDGRARIICMGWANHPGAGGPYTLPGGRIPANTGRPYLFGWEIEGGITQADWTPAFRTLMGKVHAATLAWLRRDERSHIEHKTWAPSRKVDRLGYSLSGARSELRPHLSVSAPKSQEDDMVRPRDWTAADKKAVREALFGDDKYAGNRIVKHTDYNEDWHLRTVQRRTHTMRAEQARLLEQQVAILAALEGLDADAVNAKLDQHHADYVARFEAAESQREALLGLVSAVASGERDAADVVDEIGRRLRGGKD